MNLLSEDPNDRGTWYCERCWHEWDECDDDPLAQVWSTLFCGDGMDMPMDWLGRLS